VILSDLSSLRYLEFLGRLTICNLGEVEVIYVAELLCKVIITAFVLESKGVAD
jgi:hypothetical protein